MNDLLSPEFLALGAALSELAIKGTATAVTKKLRSIKDDKNVDNIRNTYNEVINELLQEREEAIRIAQTYKSELERVVISDDDIAHLHTTVSAILDIFQSIQLQKSHAKENGEAEKIKAEVESYKQIKELISVDTLKTMQLLGFNYKAAIGEPLTQICADSISSLAKKGRNQNSQVGRRNR